MGPKVPLRLTRRQRATLALPAAGSVIWKLEPGSGTNVVVNSLPAPRSVTLNRQTFERFLRYGWIEPPAASYGDAWAGGACP